MTGIRKIVESAIPIMALTAICIAVLVNNMTARTQERNGAAEGDSCLIGGTWYGAGEAHPAGCAECDPRISTTSWTPIHGCYKIIIAALNEAYDGNLGGIEGADCLCAGQAAEAGLPGIWRAFLSSSSRNAQDLITRDTANIPVVNLSGTYLYPSWNDMLYISSGFPSEARFYTFDLTPVDEEFGEWYDADAWHGSYPDGAMKPGYTCMDWTSNLAFDIGANGELDMGIWLGGESTTCDYRLAVVCVQIAPYCECPGQGDGDNSGTVDAADVAVLINHALRGGMAPQTDPYCPAINRGDFNCDDRINLVDLVMMINYVYRQPASGPCDPCRQSP